MRHPEGRIESFSLGNTVSSPRVTSAVPRTPIELGAVKVPLQRRPPIRLDSELLERGSDRRDPSLVPSPRPMRPGPRLVAPCCREGGNLRRRGEFGGCLLGDLETGAMLGEYARPLERRRRQPKKCRLQQRVVAEQRHVGVPRTPPVRAATGRARAADEDGRPHRRRGFSHPRLLRPGLATVFRPNRHALRARRRRACLCQRRHS